MLGSGSSAGDSLIGLGSLPDILVILCRDRIQAYTKFPGDSTTERLENGLAYVLPNGWLADSRAPSSRYEPEAPAREFRRRSTTRWRFGLVCATQPFGALTFEGGQFLGRQIAPDARRKLTERNRANRDPDEAKRGMADRSGHAPDLPVAALADRQTDPGGRNILSEPDRNRALGNRETFVQQDRFGRARQAISGAAMPRSEVSMTSGVGIRSTCARYVLGW